MQRLSSNGEKPIDAGRPGTVSRIGRSVLMGFGVMAVATGLLAATGNPAQAALSPGCTLLKNGDLDFLNILGGPFSAARVYVLKKGESVIVEFENIKTFEVKFNGATVFSAPPPTSGILVYEVPTNGTVTVDKTVEGQAGKTGRTDFDCNGPSDKPTDPDDPFDDLTPEKLNAIRWALVLSLIPGAGVTNQSLPGSGSEDVPSPLTEECAERIRLAELEVARTGKILGDIEAEIALLVGLAVGTDPIATAELSRLYSAKSRAEDAFEEAESALRQVRIECGAGEDPEELGDGEIGHPLACGSRRVRSRL
jgi:hypothetical protein